MDMSFANQALCVAYLSQERGKLQEKVFPVPREIDEKIARMKLKSMGIKIDKLTAEQTKYLTDWKEGT
jgi:adenosylhomocysteinase